MATQMQEPKQSRTGKRALPIPQGVEVSIDGRRVTVKGPKGELQREVRPEVRVQQDDGQLQVLPAENAGEQGTQFQGLTRALLKNMVQGVSEGFSRTLDLLGVGYRAEVDGRTLKLVVGLSHTVNFQVPEGVDFNVETVDRSGTKYPRVTLSSTDKELLGQVAARLRSVRPPEPYKGKGVRFEGERVREKAGKAGKK